MPLGEASDASRRRRRERARERTVERSIEEERERGGRGEGEGPAREREKARARERGGGRGYPLLASSRGVASTTGIGRERASTTGKQQRRCEHYWHRKGAALPLPLGSQGTKLVLT